MKTYTIGDTWICGACGKNHTVTDKGIRCNGAGHNVYSSLEYLEGYTSKVEKDQLALF